MSSKGSLSGYESESSISPNSYLSHTMEYVVCETIPFSVSESKNSQNEYSCNICNTKKSQFQELRSHLFNHMGAIPYFCTLCNFADISLTQLYIHLLSHKEFLNDDEKRAKLKDVFNKMVYSCNLCFFSFKNNKDLATHYLKHVTNSYKCKSCKFVFFTEQELIIHAHIHSLSLVCRVCDKTFPSSQKVFLVHVLSHDQTRFYRNFPKININIQDVPFFKSFFEICSQVTNVEFPMYCGILKTHHKNLSKSKSPSLKDENRSSPIVRIFDDQRPSSLGNNDNQEAIARSGKRRNSSTEEKSDVFKLPDYPWKKKSNTDSSSPDREPNQDGIQISIASVVGSRDKNSGLETSVKVEDRSLSPLKGTTFIDEEKRYDIPIINRAYSLNQQVQNTEVFDTGNVKENINNESINNQEEASVPIPKCYISINYSNSSSSHLITNIKEELLDTDEECSGNELRSENLTNSNAFNKFSIFSKSKDFVGSSDTKDNSSVKDQGVEPNISPERKLSVLLERLPEEIMSVAKAESTMDLDTVSPKPKPAFCFKELLVVIPKLPYYVTGMASFKRYERKQKTANIQTSTPRVTRSRRSQNSNLSPLERSEDHTVIKKYASNVIKLNSESISIHNYDNTSPFEGVGDSPMKVTGDHLDCLETQKRDSSTSLSHETSVNPLLTPPSTSTAQTFIDPTQNGDLRTEDLDSMMDLDCSEHLCEEGEDCCCTVTDCDSQSLDVEEDMNRIRNRIMLLKTALNSVQETSANKFLLN